MITKANAKLIADSTNSFSSIDPTLIVETSTGNRLMDDANHLIIWTAGRGLYSAFLPLDIASGVYTQTTVINFMNTLQSLGYTIDQSRIPGYNELGIIWS